MSITEMEPRAQARPGSLTMEALAEELAVLVTGLELAALDGAEAASLTECFARIDRLAVAGMTLAAGRVAESGHHRAMGHPSAERWLADATKASTWEAARTLETARLVAGEELSATRDALVSGALTATQANEIATASAHDPSHQQALLALAARETTAQLRAECRRIRLADTRPEDPDKRRRRIVGEMAFGSRDLGDGMSELFARMPTSWLVLVLAAVRQQCEAVFAKARAEGRSDPHQAYLVEALVTLLLIGDLTGTARTDVGPFDGDGDGNGEDAGPFDNDQNDAGEDDDAAPFDTDQTDDDDAHDGDAGDAGDDADEDDDDARGDDVPGGEDTGFDTIDEDLYDELLDAIGGDHSPPRPPRRQRRAARRGRCRCGARVMPRAKIIIRTDVAALLRGFTVGDEVCDIAGVGPVPVATARELWPDAVVKAVITRGVDVLNVTHLGRRATEAMATAMQFANPACSNIACDNHRFVQVDHRLGFANVARTRLDELDPLCSCCHGLKTTENWQLIAGSGRRRFVPPGHPHHPGDPPTPRRRFETATQGQGC